MKVLVEKIARHKKGFVSDGVWYNYFRDQDKADLPKNITEGVEIELTDFTKKGENFDFTKYTVSKASSPSANKGTPDKDLVQRYIVYQNALTNAVAFHSALHTGGATTSTTQQVLATMKVFAEGVLEAASKPPSFNFEKISSLPKTKTKTKAKPSSEEEEEEETEGNVDDPYKV